MKKNYKNLKLAFVLLTAGFTATAATDPAIVLSNFDAVTVSSGTLYTGTTDGITVTVSNGASLIDQEGAVTCLSINGEFNALKLSSGGYIDIVNAGTYGIEKVEFPGSSLASGSSYPIVAVSLDGGASPVFPNNLFNQNLSYPAIILAANANIPQVLDFPADPSSACSVSSFLIPETAYQVELKAGGSVTPLSNFNNQVKIIRLRWGTGSFAGQSPSSTTNAPNIFGIKIYLTAVSTKVETGTAVAKTEQSSAFIDLTGKAAPATAKGLLIKRTVFDDGSVGYTKVYIK